MASPWAFLASATSVVFWAFTGPFFGFSDTWQLVINTTTTIITFLMAFLIQYSQDRNSKALHVKIDELIRATPEARNELINVEMLDDDQLEKLHQQLLAERESRSMPAPQKVTSTRR